MSVEVTAICGLELQSPPQSLQRFDDLVCFSEASEDEKNGDSGAKDKVFRQRPSALKLSQTKRAAATPGPHPTKVPQNSSC